MSRLAGSLARLLSVTVQVLAILAVPATSSSEEGLVLTYDLIEGKWIGTIPRTVAAGRPVSLRLINHNPFLYRITINGATESFSPPPADGKLFVEVFKGAGITTTESRGSAIAVNKDDTMAIEAMTELLRIDARKQLVVNTVLSDERTGDNIRDALAKHEGGFELKAIEQFRKLDLATDLSDDVKARRKLVLDVRTAALASFRAADGLRDDALQARFDAVSRSLNADEDAVYFEVKTERRPGLDASIKVRRELPNTRMLELDVLGGFHVALTAGPVFDTVTDEEFEIRNSRLTDSSEQDDVTVAPAVFLMGHWRTSPTFGWGMALGGGVASGDRARFHIGPSVLFGRKSRIALTAGATVGQAMVLTGPYKEGEFVPDGYLTGRTYEEAWRWGGFASISYRFAGTQP
jgi:hypothetical protein